MIPQISSESGTKASTIMLSTLRPLHRIRIKLAISSKPMRAVSLESTNYIQLPVTSGDPPKVGFGSHQEAEPVRRPAQSHR